MAHPPDEAKSTNPEAYRRAKEQYDRYKTEGTASGQRATGDRQTGNQRQAERRELIEENHLSQFMGMQDVGEEQRDYLEHIMEHLGPVTQAEFEQYWAEVNEMDGSRVGMRVVQNCQITRTITDPSQAQAMIPTVGALTTINVMLGEIPLNTMIDTGAMINVASNKAHFHAFKQFGTNVLFKAPEPIKVRGWTPDHSEELKLGVFLPITYGGQTVEIFAWLDPTCDQDLVLGAPGLAQLPLGLFDVSSGEQINPKLSDTAKMEFMKMPVKLEQKKRPPKENLAASAASAGGKDLSKTTEEISSKLKQPLKSIPIVAPCQVEKQRENKTEGEKAQEKETVEVFDYPPVWTEPGTGKRYPVDPNTGKVVPVLLD